MSTSLNPLNDDVVKIIKDKTDGFGADVVIEISGSVEATRVGSESLRKEGRVSLIGLHSQELTLDIVNNIIYKESNIYEITVREMFSN